MASRNEIEILINATDRASGVLDGMLGKIGGIGESLMKTGAAITVATAPIALALTTAVSSAVAFDESMTNVGAVLGKTRTEMTAMNEMVLRLGANSRAGPQAAADAFYDIVGGVADASSHMAILEASIRTAEAGSADLGETTNALIAVMNSYSFGAEKAGFASDVLTRTVGMGVGTMGDFASALPAVTGLAHSLDVGFGDLAAATAYLTTKGNTASQATTQLSSMMTAMMNPNETMKKGLKELGFASGDAAVKQLGLVGAMVALQSTQTASTDGMAKMLGSTEALRGVTSLTETAFRDFNATFKDGIEGATAATQAIQLDSPAAQFDLLNSKVSAMGIVVGQILIPPLLKLADAIMPVVNQVLTWAQTNPEVVTTLVGIAMAAVAVGPVIGLIGMAITGVTTAIGILLSPAVLLMGAIAGIVAAAQLGYPGGIVGLFTDATRTAQQLAFLGLWFLNQAAQGARYAVEQLVNLGIVVLQTAAENVQTAIQGVTGKVNEVVTAFETLYNQSPEVHSAVDTITLAVTMLTLAWGGMQLIMLAVKGAMAAYTTITWGLSAAKSALAIASTAASGGFAAFAASAAAALGPILLVVGAVAAAAAAINNFNNTVEEGRGYATDSVKEASAKGMTEEELWQQVKKSTVAEYGYDSPIVDGIARGIFNDMKSQMVQPVAGAKAGGGWMMGGRTYLTGERGPELVNAPQGGAYVTPNHQMGGSGGQPIYINVQMPEAALTNPIAAQQAGMTFGESIGDELKRRGFATTGR
jgi:TP901 family phage tail tape measure protein